MGIGNPSIPSVCLNMFLCEMSSHFIYYFTLLSSFNPIVIISPSTLWKRKTETDVCSPQVHCEDHRRCDVVVPHGHHQGFHHQPFPSCSYLQTEEHQQAGADPPQPTAFIQVRSQLSETAD